MLSFLISIQTLYKIINSKTLIKVINKILMECDCYTGVIENLTVSRLTRELKYKNKSTVSRALKELRELEFIIPTAIKNEYQVNNFLLMEPI